MSASAPWLVGLLSCALLAPGAPAVAQSATGALLGDAYADPSGGPLARLDASTLRRLELEPLRFHRATALPDGSTRAQMARIADQLIRHPHALLAMVPRDALPDDALYRARVKTVQDALAAHGADPRALVGFNSRDVGAITSDTGDYADLVDLVVLHGAVRLRFFPRRRRAPRGRHLPANQPNRRRLHG